MVTKKEDGWGVTGAGNSRVPQRLYPHSGKQSYSAKAIATNQGGDVVIHGKDGHIRERNSYGNDPNPPKG